MSQDILRYVKMFCSKENKYFFWHYYYYWLCQDGLCQNGVKACNYCPYYIDKKALFQWDCAGYAELVEVLR